MRVSLLSTMLITAHKKSFPLRIFSANVIKSAVFFADLVTLTEETLNGKLHFLFSVYSVILCYIFRYFFDVKNDFICCKVVRLKNGRYSRLRSDVLAPCFLHFLICNFLCSTGSIHIF